MTQDSLTYPSTGFADLLRLLGSCLAGLAKSPLSFDFSTVFDDWLKDLMRQRRSRNIILNLYFKKLLAVTGRELSEHILAQSPDALGYVEGTTKARAMPFLAPQALTITHGEQWRRLRRFNETALQVNGADARVQFIVEAVCGAFPGPVSDIGDIRQYMTQAMLLVVFGPRSAPVHVAEDVQKLFGHVRVPEGGCC